MRAFTLIEILIVLGMISCIANVAMFASMDSLRALRASSEREALTDMLFSARARAMYGACEGASCTDGAPFGVHVSNTARTLFQGKSYAEREGSHDEVVRTEAEVLSQGEVVFEPTTGHANEGIVFKLGNVTGRYRVSVDTHGMISSEREE